MENQSLFFHGSELKNNNTLSECKVQKECTLELKEHFKITLVRIRTNELFKLEVEPTELVLKVKQRIFDKIGRMLICYLFDLVVINIL